MTQSPRPARVFVSYAHEDRVWCEKLLTHLGALTTSGRIRTFDDSELVSGDWEQQLKSELSEADVVVLVVSASFGKSVFCTGVELKQALERYEHDTVLVIPILAEHCDWQALPIKKFQVLPQDEQRNLKPLSDWRNKNKPLAHSLHDSRGCRATRKEAPIRDGVAHTFA